VAGVQELLPVLQAGPRQEYLGDTLSVAAKAALIELDQSHLSHCCCSLLLAHGAAAVLPSKLATPHRYRARRHQYELLALVGQFCQLLGEIAEFS